MTQVQTGPTDAQLVALAERLGFDTTGLPPSVHNRKVRLPARFGWGEWHQIRWLTSWEGMGAIQAAMAGLGWSLTLHARPSSTSYAKPYFAGFYRLEDVGEGRADAGPDAIVLAACAALGVTG